MDGLQAYSNGPTKPWPFVGKIRDRIIQAPDLAATDVGRSRT
jgi:hypothetical protein